MHKIDAFLHRHHLFREPQSGHGHGGKRTCFRFRREKTGVESTAAHGNGAYCRMRFPGKACGLKTSRLRTVRGGGPQSTS
jgi:hypothetical protein